VQQLPFLQDQVAIVTGASSGIGMAVARQLHDAGMSVVATARRAERLKQLTSQLPQCDAFVADIADEATPQALLDRAVERFGRLDLVFNGAGVMFAGTIEDVDVDQLCRMVRVNCEASIRLAYTAVKYFKQVGSGHLINVSSILGTKVRPGTGVYAATKYAIEALSEALRMELAKTNVKVSVIEPGVVETELQNHFPVHPKDALGITHPLSPDDVARCVRFLIEQPSHVRIPVMMVLPGEQPM
jgi:NADP-dependent 3-hydroxy acid dehydrogenase YdfG